MLQPGPDADARLLAFLVTRPGLPYCQECLAHELSLARAVVIGVLLEIDSVVRHAHRACARCSRTTETIEIAQGE